MDNNSMMLIDNNGSFEIDDQSHMDVDPYHNHSVALVTPTKPNEEGPNADTDDVLLPEPVTQPGKRRRKKSMVWEHFTIETASPGSTKACCKHCRKSFAYITGQKLAGTSHLKRHIQLGICPMSRDNSTFAQICDSKDPTTGPPKKRQRSSGPYMNVPLDQGRCYNEMAKMIIMHDYPLHMVEHSGFTGFVQALRPQFNMASFNTIHSDCVTMYLSEKQKLSEFISEIPGRVNLTVDLWTSNQSVGYAFVTGHFIDKDWNLTHRLLNVSVVPSPDSDYALNQPIAACLSDWNLERKLSSLTVGQSVVSKTCIENLRCCLSARNQHVLNGQLLLGNCYARLLSSMAQDLLRAEDLETPIKKVRDSVKYVKTKDSCGERFDELKRQLQTPSTKDLLIDNQTKWDTSYNMLLAASEHKEVFSCLGNCDPDYKVSTSPEEWRKIETLCSCLKFLFDAANVLTGPTRLTANDLYHEMTKLQLELSNAAMSEDPDVRNLANPLREKFDEYWRGCFLLLAIAVVMDPRFKMKLIEFSFSKAYGEDADKWIRSVDDAVHDLYHDYAEQSHSLLDAYVGHGNDGFSETDMSQVHFHHEMPHDYHHSNGLSHDQIYEQTEDGNPLNDKTRDQSQEVAQTQVNQLDVESLPHAQEEQEDQSMEGLSGEGQQTGTVSVGDNTTQGVEQEVHLVDAAGTEENHMVERLSAESKPMEGPTQESLPTEENLQANGEPTLAQESLVTDETSHESQAKEETPRETQAAEECPCESQPAEETPQESQPVEDILPERHPAEKQMEDTDMTQDNPGEENVPETQPVEEMLEDTQPVEEVAEEFPLKNEQADDKDITQDTEPVEEMLEETRGVVEVAEETQLVEEKHDDIQPVDEVGHEAQAESHSVEERQLENQQVDEKDITQDTQPVEEVAEDAQSVEEVADDAQPVEEMVEDTQPVEEVAQEAQLAEEKHDEIQHVEEVGHDTQPVEGTLEDTQPVEEVAQEVQPAEQSPEHSQNPQNADGILGQEYPREGEAVQQEQQEQHPSEVHHVEEAQHDPQSHAMPQEEAGFTISQEGHHVDVLLQEGHHLEASSQEFPLITIGDGFSDFELYISEVGSHQQMKSELDQYLEESLIPRSQDFEVLGWWSLNRTKYPTLSKMAADVLSLPFSTVSPDSVFDTEVKKMDNYKSSLRHVTLEALFCAKDWFKHGSSTSNSEINLKRES